MTIKNEASAFKKLIKNRVVQSLCFVMEATGGYEKPLVSFLLTENIKVAVVNAKRVRDFANAMGAYAKNDRIDATMIRYYAETAYAKGRMQLREPRSEVEQRIEALVKRRHQVVEQRAVEQHRQRHDTGFDAARTRQSLQQRNRRVSRRCPLQQRQRQKNRQTHHLRREGVNPFRSIHGDTQCETL